MMTGFLLMTAALAGAPVDKAPSLLPAGYEFRLVWHDEFDGDRLDESKWSYRTNFWGIRFPAFAAPEQNAVEVKDGCAHLKLIKLPNGEFAAPQLQTGEILWDAPAVTNTTGFWPLGTRVPAKFEHRYGYYECRCRLQQEEGWWSAFWMQTAAQGATLDPARSGIEHDIMESFEPGVVEPACFHYNGYGAEHVGFQAPRLKGEKLNAKMIRAAATEVDKTVFHTFGMLWEPDGYTLYIDGKQRGPKVGRGKNYRGQDEAVSAVPEFLLISTEPKWYRRNRMTGKGVPELEAAWKAGDAFLVDYVRVYDIVKDEPAPFPTWSAPRAVTAGPHEHLLASYFAIDSWSPDKRYLLVLETDVNGRLPAANERCTLGVVDLQDGNRFIPITTTACWNFQEAAMAHWMNQDEILFNDVRGGKFVTVILNWKTKAERTLPMPVSAVSEDRTWAVSVNYARLALTRPDYGYAGPGQDARRDVECPADDGLWTMDLRTGECRLIASVAATRPLESKATWAKPKPAHQLSYHCHTVISKDGEKIFFLVRTVDIEGPNLKEVKYWETTALTVSRDGSDIRRCFRDGWQASHFNWAPDGSHKMLVTAVWDGEKKGRPWSKTNWSLVEFEVGKEAEVRRIGAGILDQDWHCVYSPDGKFMSGETYWNKNFERPWTLVRLSDGMNMPMGTFYVPEAYRGAYWRCDLHARYRPDGRQIAFNSVHEGSRQVYVRDIE